MDKTAISSWRSGLAINLVSSFVAWIVGCAATYLLHEGSSWVKPVLAGGLTWLLTFCSILVFRVMRNLPQRQEAITYENLPGKVRSWLDSFGLKVQTVKMEDRHFNFIVTTDGGWVISISRDITHFPDYLTYRAFYSDDAQEKAFHAFTDSEKAEVRLATKLEISRAVMGYTTKDILEGFTLFKRIPIRPDLDIEDVSTTLWEVEAALTSVFTVGAMYLFRKQAKAS